MKSLSMKRLIGLLLILSLVLTAMPAAPNASASTAVPLANPGFEEPSLNGAIPAWTQIYGKSGISVADSVYAYSGNSSLRFVDASNQSSIGIQSDKVSITAGKTYKASTKLKLLSGEVFMYLYFFDAAGNKLSEARNTNRAIGEWVTLNVIGAAPPEAAQAAVMFYAGVTPVSEAYWDDVSLEPTLSAPEQLGEVVGTTISQGVAFGVNAKGDNELYFALNGKPAVFYAVNAETMEVNFSQPLPGLDVVWAITTAPDGNVYFSGTTNSRIYRYSPDTKEIRNMADNRTYNPWVWDMEASRDGKIYGSTYPHARVFEYDIATNASRIFSRDLTTEQYARGIGVTDEHVYVGIGTKAYLYKINRVTGERQEIMVPNRGNPGTSISKAWIYNGKLLVRSGGSRLFVFDEQSGQLIRGGNEDYINFQYSISPPSPHNLDLIYYKLGDSLHTYNLATNTIEQVPSEVTLPQTAMRGFSWITLKTGNKAGQKVLIGLTEFGDFIQYDPTDNELIVTYPKVTPQGVLIQSLESGPNGHLYIGGYQGGMSVYDPWGSRIAYSQPQFNQSEGIGFLDELSFFGTYSSAKIYRYDVTQPVWFGHNPSNNPGLVLTVGHEQDRPFAFAAGDDKLFVGTVPYYGVLGGALAIYDRKKDEWTVHRNVVQDQSIISLEYRDGRLYGATSVYGGLGSTPTAAEAKVFVWDVKTGMKLKEVTPVIPGIDAVPKAIGELRFGPDGKLWGAAQGTVFVMDPDTLNVERSKLVYPSDWNVTHYWRPVFLRWGPDDMLYTTLGRKLTVIDPLTLDSVALDDTALMTFGEDGHLYYAKDAKLFRIRMEYEDKQAVSMKSSTTPNGYEATVSLHGAKNVTGGKLELEFDNHVFQVESITPSAAASNIGITYENGNDGKLVVHLHPEKGESGSLTGDVDLLTIRFELKNNRQLPANTSVVFTERSRFTTEREDEKGSRIPPLSPVTRWIGFR